MENKKIYLAIPYTFNPQLSFEISNRVGAELMSKGNVVFSPISHSHPIADHLPNNLRTDSNWWMRQDLPFVDWADEINVVVIGDVIRGLKLIDESKGVQMEIRYAIKTGKPIQFLTYEQTGLL